MSIAMPLYCTLRSFLVTERERMNDEHGEGVISAAIAVLIIASLGALMWIGFRTIWENAESTTNSKISEIGN
ncbi:MAG: hypothetical protein ACKVHU_15010 [Acidimicrobiales bacterium]|jgi:hypothetical protein